MRITIQRLFTESLRTQLILSVFTVFALFIATFETAIVRMQTDLLHDRLIVRSQNYGKLIAASSLQWVLTGDIVAIDETMAVSKELPEVLYVAVVDLQGKVLGHTNSQEVGKQMLDKEARTLLEQARVSLQPVILSNSATEVESATPQVQSGRTVGFVRVRLSGSPTQELLEKYTIRMTLIGVLLLLVGTGLAFIIGQRLIGALPILTTKLSAFRVGDPIPLLPETRADEIGALARQIRQFMTELNQKNVEVAGYHRELEQRVRERTEELAVQTAELQRMNSFFVDREIRMAELKKENQALLERNQGNKDTVEQTPPGSTKA